VVAREPTESICNAEQRQLPQEKEKQQDPEATPFPTQRATVREAGSDIDPGYNNGCCDIASCELFLNPHTEEHPTGPQGHYGEEHNSNSPIEQHAPQVWQQLVIMGGILQIAKQDGDGPEHPKEIPCDGDPHSRIIVFSQESVERFAIEPLLHPARQGQEHHCCQDHKHLFYEAHCLSS